MSDNLLGLAHRLALDFGQTSISDSSCRALTLLLPGVKYCSLVVEHRGMSSLVSVSNFMIEGLGELAVHDMETAIAGLVLYKRRPLQGSLRGSSGKVLTCLTDVQSMLAKDHTIEFIVCLPIEPLAPVTSSSAPPPDSSEKAAGAMLLGFASPPDLGRRRLAAITLLCQLLSSTLPRPMHDMLSLVAHLCGTAVQCTCCLSDEENSDEEEETRGSPCRIHKPGPDGPEAGPQSLRVPLDKRGSAYESEESEDGVADNNNNNAKRYSTDSASTFYAESTTLSSADADSTHGGGDSTRSSYNPRLSFDAAADRAAAAASTSGVLHRAGTTPAQAQQQEGYGDENEGDIAPVRPTTIFTRPTSYNNVDDNTSGGGNCGEGKSTDWSYIGDDGLQQQSLGTEYGVEDAVEWDDAWALGSSPFSKAFLADLQHTDLERRHPIWLTFAYTPLEHEFSKWYARRQQAADFLFSLLLLLSLVMLAVQRPFGFSPLDHTSRDSILAVILALPLFMVAFGRGVYLKYRDTIMTVMRLYMVGYINWVSLPAFQALMPNDPWWKCLSFWFLSGGESLSSAALGMQVRMALHIPLQFATLAVAAWHIPGACASCYPSYSAGMCVAAGVSAAGAIGCIVPSLMLWSSEKRARNVFSWHLASLLGQGGSVQHVQ